MSTSSVNRALHLFLCTCAGGWRIDSWLEMENFKDLLFYFWFSAFLWCVQSSPLSQPCLNWKNVITHLKRNNTVATHMSNRANRKQLISNIGFYQKSRNKSCLDTREASKNKMFVTQFFGFTYSLRKSYEDFYICKISVQQLFICRYDIVQGVYLVVLVVVTSVCHMIKVTQSYYFLIKLVCSFSQQPQMIKKYNWDIHLSFLVLLH